ncbi:TPA: hypothetical protein I8374_000592 [Serratia marcescens]|nr:hypothetical protein [Serratia marcescens]HAT2871784.1 hypothetical protein [Serratia marcescens]HAT2922074.1 hypothetical protein [Serratia marcescens]
MAVLISGKLIGPNGDPRQNVTITLVAVKTSSAVVKQAPSSSTTTTDGSYSLSVEVGTHSVMIEAYGRPFEKAGQITVYSDSKPGTLNDYLTVPGENELTPAIVAIVDDMRTAAEQASFEAKEAAKQAKASEEISQSGANAYPNADAAQKAIDDGTETRQYFPVWGLIGGEVWTERYENVNGVATPTGEYIKSGAAIDRLESELNDFVRFGSDAELSARWIDDDENTAMGLTNSGELLTFGGLNGADPENSAFYAWGISDGTGNVALGVTPDGATEAHDLNYAGVEARENKFGPLLAWTDEAGNIALGVSHDGTLIAKFPENISTGGAASHTLTLETADTIMHVGDSLTEAMWVVKDKSWMSVLGEFSPYRHINYGWSGNTLIDMQTRVLQQTSTYRSTMQQQLPRFGFISSFGNDSFMARADLKYYQESLQRLVDVMRPVCEQVVIVTEYCATVDIRTIYEEVARQNNLPYIHTDALAYRLNKINLGGAALFHQGHLGTRNQGIWWYPILEWIKEQPIRKGIKIYRSRTTPADISELIVKNDYDRYTKFKELTVGHNYLSTDTDYDEIGDTSVSWKFGHSYSVDEYLTLQNGGTLDNGHALVELYLEHHPKDISELTINVATSDAKVYVMDSTDPSVNLSGRVIDDAFIAKYDKPRSVWKEITQQQSYSGSRLLPLFSGRKITLLVVGGKLINPIVEYKSAGRAFVPVGYPYVHPASLGSELATAKVVGDASWVKSSGVKTLKPIDKEYMPRAENSKTTLTDVFSIPAGESIGQTLNMAPTEEERKFRLQVWARYFPKGYLDMSKSIYAGFDPNQVVDSRSNPAPVTRESIDVRRLHANVRVSDGEANWTVGSTAYSDIVGLTWRPVNFYINVAPYTSEISLNLTAPDGELQIARLSIKEVM